MWQPRAMSSVPRRPLGLTVDENTRRQRAAEAPLGTSDRHKGSQRARQLVERSQAEAAKRAAAEAAEAATSGRRKKKKKMRGIEKEMAARLLAPAPEAKRLKNRAEAARLAVKATVLEMRAEAERAIARGGSWSDGDEDWRGEEVLSETAEKKTSRVRRMATGAFYGTDAARAAEASFDRGSGGLAPALEARLRPHQIEAVRFICARLAPGSPGGAMLCDEMGLGKTATTLAAIGTLMGVEGTSFARARRSARCIIACPAGVAHTWLAEAQKWWKPSPEATKRSASGGPPHVKIFAEVGAGAVEHRRAKKRDRLLGVQPRGLDDHEDVAARFARCSLDAKPVLIISYEGYRARAARLNALRDVGFLVCDEAHRLKGDQTQAFAALDASPASRRLLVTATPVQNGVRDLKALLELCDPSRRKDDLASANGLRRVLRALAIRRRICDAPAIRASLPPKTEALVLCPAGPGVQSRALADLAEDFGAFPPKKRHESSTKTASALRAVNAACLACSSPEAYLGRDATNDATTKNAALSDDDDAPVDDLETCGKWREAIEIILRIRATTTDRVVVVSRYSAVLDATLRFAAARDLEAARIDGSTDLDRRAAVQARLNAPNSDLFLLALSLRAGGLGLSLVGAARLILFEPSWNPAEDDQAVARLFRFGQTRPVFVYKLAVAGSVEVKVLERQHQKRRLIADLRRHIEPGRDSSAFDDLLIGADDDGASLAPEVAAVKTLGVADLVAFRPDADDHSAGLWPRHRAASHHDLSRRDPVLAAALLDGSGALVHFQDVEHDENVQPASSCSSSHSNDVLAPT